jgi:hypothetical protein
MTEENLARCPFCRKRVATIWEGIQIDSEGEQSAEYRAECNTGSGGCGASVYGDTEQEAIDRWNTRPPSFIQTLIPWAVALLIAALVITAFQAAMGS